MEMLEKVLNARENKKKIIESYLDKYQVITLKANIAGENKNTKEAYILLSYFDILINKFCIEKKIIDDYDGPMVLYLCSKDKLLKQEMINIEENNILGRFIDIDVFFNSDISISRGILRKCYLCNSPAFVCARERKHSIEEINEFLKINLLIELKKIIYNLCEDAIMTELNLHPKFGLVTPYCRGSHKDMDYNLMIKAKETIIPYFIKMFEETYNSIKTINEVFEHVRIIGIEAENAMLLKTNGINAYKGLIFALGLFVTAVAFKFNNLLNSDSIFDIIKKMTKGISKESNEGLDTFGKIAYQKYGIKGARFEAEEGFTSVQHCLKKFSLDNEKSYYEALCYLISHIDDTVLLKRCNNIQNYLNTKLMFEDFKYDKEKIKMISNYCIENNLSFGGSADLFIVLIFIKKLLNNFCIDLFEK